MFQAGDPLTAATLKKWAKQCRNDHKHRIMMNMAKTSLLFHPNKDLGEAWDGNPMMLGMPHGVLDLSDGRIMTGAIARDKFCSMTTRGTVASPDEIDSDPDLKRCWERWQSLLDDWLPDKDTRETVQEIMGTSMVGRLDEHIWVFQSTGRGGKSTLLDACKIAMGDYRYEISGPVVTNKATDNSKSSAIAGLDGKRLIVISEVGGRMLDAEMLKQLTGETETMGRAMRSNPQPVQNVGSYFIMTNHAVDLHGDQSEALRGRLVIVPFVRRFVDHTRLGEQEYRSARAEGSVLERSDQVKHIAMGREPGWERMPDAVLTWMFNGWERVRERGHVVFSEAMTSITNRVWAESDWLTTYFTESGLWVPDGFTVVSTPGLTQNISDWALSTDQEELNKMLLRNPSQVVAEQLKKMEGRGYQFVGKSTRALWMNGKRQVNAWRVPWTFIGG
jgi:phage/plasmid-associated DNA primase